MTTLTDIEAKTKAYAIAHEKLVAAVADLNTQLEQAKRKALPDIKHCVARALERRSELRAALADAPEIFEKPRTHIFHGVKVGYGKGKGKVEFDDADKVCALIRKHLPDQAEVLILTEEKPNKEAIAALDASDVKRIACQVTGTGDAVVIKPTDSDVDKIVKALLKEDVEEGA